MLLQNINVLFLLILHLREDRVSWCDCQQMRHCAKLLVYPQTWIQSDSITLSGTHHNTVDLALVSMRSTIAISLCASPPVCEVFVIKPHALDPWRLKNGLVFSNGYI